MNWFQIIKKFIKQAEDEDLKTSLYPDKYNGLRVRVSFGQGTPAKVPWIAFLDEGSEVRKGIYPVYLYFKKFTTLVLCFGVSETESSKRKWPEGVRTSNLKVSEYFHEEVWRYHNSLVFKGYKILFNNDIRVIYNNNEIDEVNFEDHLYSITNYYKSLYTNKYNFKTPSGKNSLNLIGGEYDKELTKREKKILNLYRKGDTYEEIGEKFDLSRQRVHQLKSKILRKDLAQKTRQGLYFDIKWYIKDQKQRRKRRKKKMMVEERKKIEEEFKDKKLSGDVWGCLSDKYGYSIPTLKKKFPKYHEKIKEIKENRWHYQHDKCKECGTTKIPFYAKGLCESCHPKGKPRGERRERIIKNKGSNCERCKMERDKVQKDTGRDFYVSDKFSEKKGDYEVYCQKCFFSKMGSKYGLNGNENTNCLFIDGKKITNDIVNSIAFKDLKKLSERERSIILMWGQGKLFEEIADIFNVIDLTVRNSIRKSLKEIGEIE